MIINIRGGNASGKSWVVRQVMAKYPPGPAIPHISGKIEGYTLTSPVPCFVLGKYTDANTGGADTFKDMDEIEEIIYRQVVDEGRSVIFEGIRVHGAHNRWIDFAQRYKGVITKDEYHFLVLNTRPEQSRVNMIARRAAIGVDKSLSPATLESIDDMYRRGLRQLKHFPKAGLWVKHVSSQKAVDLILDWIA